MSANEQIMSTYDAEVHVYESLEKRTYELLSTLLDDAGVEYHSLTSRCKERKSLEGKISREGKNYCELSDLTDVVGFRITTYFAGDVDKVAELIEKELILDEDNSIDKRKAAEPDRFGYMSLHLVASHKDERTCLPEYKCCAGKRFEIQIRTILQHAWAEIEHDMGYKSESAVPQTVRRRFSRLAGLLELADEEFQIIRNQLSKYKDELPEKIKTEPQDILLDAESLIEFVKTDELVKEFNKVFIPSIADELDDSMDAGDYNRLLGLIGITTVAELSEACHNSQQYFEPFIRRWFADIDWEYKVLSLGVSIFYVMFITMALKMDVAEIKKIFITWNLDEQTADDFSEKIVQVIELVQDNEAVY